MPSSRGRNTRQPVPPVERSSLKIPQAQAEAELKERIAAGRELADTQIPGLDTSGSPLALRADFRTPYGGRGTKSPELDALRRRVSIWRDYNQTWLDTNLGGEAARQYESASAHWGVAVDEPAIRLRYLRENIESEISTLESIHDRLHMWSAEQALGTSHDRESGAASDAPIFIVHGRDTMRAESVARTVERATKRQTVILREQPNLGQTLIEKFETHAARASYAIIVLTPDDRGSLASEPATNPRARQNVIFEMGYFYGKVGRRNVTVLIHPSVEKPSDTDGIAYVTLDDSGNWKHELFRELRHANFDITL